ncbi:DUF6182 family protein [Micromonospora mangrovi]|uniref:DUF6182 family protein n=2 Tax=Micromonospora TaxID=1873 RepID=A0AAU8HG61_9ACTN
MITHDRLAADLLAERLTWVGNDSAGDADATVLVVLRALDLVDLVHGTRAFVADLDPADAARWRRSYTRTRFLFGNPSSLGDQHAPRRSRRATAAWLGPYRDSTPGVARLLKPVTGRMPPLPRTVRVPGIGRARRLEIAMGASVVDYLVHLHHTLAEAALMGRLAPEEPLLLRHRADLADRADSPAAYARVLPDPDAPDGLRLHTWLSPR